MQDSDYSTGENKKNFIHKSFKINENEILDQDEKRKEEVIKIFLENFSVLALHSKHYGKTDVLEFVIHGKTDVLEFVIHKKRSEKMNVEYQ